MVELSRQFREKCESISSNYRSELGLHIYDPLWGRTLAQTVKAELLTPHQIINWPSHRADELVEQTDWWGIILSFKPRQIVYHPHQLAPRFESTIMHELAHFILNHPAGHLYMAPDGSFQRDFDDLVEAEAAYLGSCLQIPRRGLQWTVQQGFDHEAIAVHFGASLEMVRWRRNMCMV